MGTITSCDLYTTRYGKSGAQGRFIAAFYDVSARYMCFPFLYVTVNVNGASEESSVEGVWGVTQCFFENGFQRLMVGVYHRILFLTEILVKLHAHYFDGQTFFLNGGMVDFSC